MSDSAQISVFSKIPMALAYLFKPGFLVYVVALAIFSVLLYKLTGIATILLFIGIIAFIYKCYDSASLIVEGDDEEVPYAMATNIAFATPLKFILVQIVINFVISFILGMIIGTSSVTNPQAAIMMSLVSGVIVNIFFIVINPAITMLMIQTQSFRQTINPANWFGFINSVGVGTYLLISLVLLLASVVFIGISSIVIVTLPPAVGFGVGGFFMALYAGFNFTYIAYCSRADYKRDEVFNTVDKAISDDLHMAKQAWEKGNREDAVNSLLVTVDNTNDWKVKTPLLLQVFQYYDEMEQPEKKARWMDQMFQQIATKDHQNFPLILDELKHKVEKGEKLLPDLIYPLANLALINKEPNLVLNLTLGFNKSYPNHRDIPGNLFVSAKAYKSLRNQEQAFRILTYLIKKYPNDDEIAEFKSQLSDVKTKLKAKQALAKSRANKA